MTSALDLITTPVGVLNGFGLETRVGLSGEDPLAVRRQGEGFRLLLSWYDPEGRAAGREELPPLAPGERRLLDLGTLARARFGAADVLAVVHRVPLGLCPEGDPAAMPAPDDHGDFDLFRTMVEYGWPDGGRGGVIYEMPPRFNAGPRPASTLVFSSKLAFGAATETVLCLLNYSLDPEWRRAVSLPLRIHDSAGALRTERTVTALPFRPTLIPLRDLVGPGTFATYSLVGWSRDGSVVPLFLQLNRQRRSIAVEHSHPPQSYLLTVDPAERFRIKERAVAQWEARA